MLDREEDHRRMLTSATDLKLRSHFVSVSTPTLRRATSTFFLW